MTGSGTAADPYIISDVDDLQAMKDDVTAYYELGGDIDASATSGWNAGDGFIPVGNAGHGTFSGQLDGKGYKITSLFARWQLGETYPVAGLFYSSSGTIQNLGLESCDITGVYAAALVGHTNSGTITKCYATGAVVGDSFGAGLVLLNTGTITNCYSRCSVTGDGSGFLAGFNEGNTGGTIDDCYSTGAVSNGTFEEGFAWSEGTITNCFWDTETSGQSGADGGTGKTTAQMKTEATFTGAGWNFGTIWYIDGVTNGSYPALGMGHATYPSDNVSRVTSLIHRYDRGTYTLELGLGEVIADFGLPEWDSKPREAWTPPTEEMIEEYEPPTWIKKETPATTLEKLIEERKTARERVVERITTEGGKESPLIHLLASAPPPEPEHYTLEKINAQVAEAEKKVKEYKEKLLKITPGL